MKGWKTLKPSSLKYSPGLRTKGKCVRNGLGEGWATGERNPHFFKQAGNWGLTMVGAEAHHLGRGTSPRRREGSTIRPEGRLGPGITPVCGQRGDVSEGRGAGKTGHEPATASTPRDPAKTASLCSRLKPQPSAIVKSRPD